MRVRPIYVTWKVFQNYDLIQQYPFDAIEIFCTFA